MRGGGWQKGKKNSNQFAFSELAKLKHIARERKDLSHAAIFGCVCVGALLGCVLTFASIEFGLIPLSNAKIVEQSVQYADVITVMLTTVTVLVAVLGIGVAILAFFGFSWVKNEARLAADLSVTEFLKSVEGETALRKIFQPVIKQLVEESLDAFSYRSEPKMSAEIVAENSENEHGD